MSRSAPNRERRFLLWVGGAMLAVIALISVLAPSTADDDPRPTSYNTGPAGAKAAYLMFEALGRSTKRREQPIGEMSAGEAARTTLILAEPSYPFKETNAIKAQLAAFLHAGGHVLATGERAALLLPGGVVKPPQMLAQGLCFSMPKDGPLAGAGPVEIHDVGRWAGTEKGLEVAQRCASDAVVVRFPVGRGEVVWWSSATPLSNAGLRHNGNLRLLLLSVGEGRSVAFDEGLRTAVKSYWSEAKGLPLWWMLGQFGLVFGLLVLSFGRRRGPVREPGGRPRSSPVEFAESMGDLYERGGATAAATEAARRRLFEVLRREAGLSRETMDEGPEAVAAAMHERFGGDWEDLRYDLQEADIAAGTEASAKSALALVKALRGQEERVRMAARGRTATAVEASRVA